MATAESLNLQGQVLVHFKRKPWEIRCGGPIGSSTQIVCPESSVSLLVRNLIRKVRTALACRRPLVQLATCYSPCLLVRSFVRSLACSSI